MLHTKVIDSIEDHKYKTLATYQSLHRHGVTRLVTSHPSLRGPGVGLALPGLHPAVGVAGPVLLGVAGLLLLVPGVLPRGRGGLGVGGGVAGGGEPGGRASSGVGGCGRGRGRPWVGGCTRGRGSRVGGCGRGCSSSRVAGGGGGGRGAWVARGGRGGSTGVAWCRGGRGSGRAGCCAVRPEIHPDFSETV